MRVEPWRYRCPEGHSSPRYRSTTDDHYCRSCGRAYDQLVDRKTGQRVDRRGGSP